MHAREIAAEKVKIGIATGEVFLGSIGHPDYKRPDVIGEPVSIALLAADWAAEHTASGVVCTCGTLEAVSDEGKPSLPVGKHVEASLPGIKNAVQLIPIGS
jgi:class 3 adenylate cyclase